MRWSPCCGGRGVRHWVRDLPRAERDLLVAAEHAYRQERRDVADTHGMPDDTNPGVREPEAVRDAAFQWCVDASVAAVQPALFEVTEHQAVLA